MKKKILISIIIFLIIIFVGGYVFLRSSYTLGKVRSIAESMLSDQFKREVSIGEISGNIFSGLTIKDIAIAKYDELSKGKLAEIESIEADYSLHNLIRLRFDINQVTINKPNISVEMDKNGKLSLPELSPQTEGKKPSRLKVVLSNIQISSGTVKFDDKRDSASVILYGVNGKISGNKDNEFAGKITADQGQVKFQKITKGLSNITTSFETTGDKIILSELGLKIGSSNLYAKGEVLNSSGKYGCRIQHGSQ
jgi:uncharacterized protein involved in outer membrane biogenesis